MIVEGLVTTVIPVHNRPAMLREAVASVLAQSYRPVEIILVDDASDDDTPNVCRDLASSHVEVRECVRLNENVGPGAARERGRMLARGEFLQYLDSDDLLLPRKFEVQVAALRENPQCGLAYCKTREYVIGDRPLDEPSRRTGIRHEFLFPALLTGRLWGMMAPLFRRSISDAAGPWTSLRQDEDWEYEARIAAAGPRLVWCPEFLAEQRHHLGARAGGRSREERERMRSRVEAHKLIYQHACSVGIGREDADMQNFAKRLFLLARQCSASRFEPEARQFFALARLAARRRGRTAMELGAYGVAATIIGWKSAGRLAELIDRWRDPRTA